MSDQIERRKAVLSETDFERIGSEFDRRLQVVMEPTGIDLSTPESRARTRRTLEFASDAMEGTQAVKRNFIRLIFGTAIPGICWGLWQAAKAMLSQHGHAP